jgi:hypothetical protein
MQYPGLTTRSCLRKRRSNLVGILNESGAQKFDAVHNMGAQTVAKATTEAGIGTLVQFSAIGADPALRCLAAVRMFAS